MVQRKVAYCRAMIFLISILTQFFSKNMARYDWTPFRRDDPKNPNKPPFPNRQTADAITSANWMKGIPDRTRLFDLYIPGAHDAATGSYSDSFLSSLVVTQPISASISEQLKNGIRFLDLRFGVDFSEFYSAEKQDKAKSIKLYHTFPLDVNLHDVLEQVHQFLLANPSETVIVSLQPDAGQGVRRLLTPGIIREVLNLYTNYSLKDNRQLALELGAEFPGLDTDNDRLFIQSYKDFDAIRKLRPFRGLGNLDKSFDLTVDVKSGTPYDPKKEIPNVRKQAVEKINNKDRVPVQLNYSGLAIGDVRGKIIFAESNFVDYNGYGWGIGYPDPTNKFDPLLNETVDPLDFQGLYTTGQFEQNNYNGPEYVEKRRDIQNFALNQGRFRRDELEDRRLLVNWTSASTAFFKASKAPWEFARNINSSTKRDYTFSNIFSLIGKNEWTNVASLASALHKLSFEPSKPDVGIGDLTRYNISQKLNGKRGLNGVIVGDFYTLEDRFYGDSSFYGLGKEFSPVSTKTKNVDWLTQRMWRQSAVRTPLLSTQAGNKDALSGLSVVREGEKFTLDWFDYLGPDEDAQLPKPRIFDGTRWLNLSYRLRQVDCSELGLKETPSRSLGMRSQTTFTSEVNKVRKFNGAAGSGLSNFAPGPEVITTQGSPGADGDRFFRLDLMASNGQLVRAIGAPTYFMVTDV